MIAVTLRHPEPWTSAMAQLVGRFPGVLATTEPGSRNMSTAGLDIALVTDPPGSPGPGRPVADRTIEATVVAPEVPDWRWWDPLVRRCASAIAHPADRSVLASWAQHECSEEYQLPWDRTAPRRARDVLTKVFTGHARVSDMHLVVSELVTNALHYAEQPLQMLVHRSTWFATIEVVDASPTGQPVVRPFTMDDIGGRGMAIVHDVADLWGMCRATGSKSIWSTFSAAPT